MAMDDRLRKFTKDLEMLKFAEPTQYDIQGAPVYNPPKVVTGNQVKRPNIFNPTQTFFDIANKKIGVGVTSGDVYDDAVAAEAARVSAENAINRAEADKRFESDKADTFGDNQAYVIDTRDGRIAYVTDRRSSLNTFLSDKGEERENYRVIQGTSADTSPEIVSRYQTNLKDLTSANENQKKLLDVTNTVFDRSQSSIIEQSMQKALNPDKYYGRNLSNDIIEKALAVIDGKRDEQGRTILDSYESYNNKFKLGLPENLSFRAAAAGDKIFPLPFVPSFNEANKALEAYKIGGSNLSPFTKTGEFAQIFESTFTPLLQFVKRDIVGTQAQKTTTPLIEKIEKQTPLVGDTNEAALRKLKELDNTLLVELNNAISRKTNLSKTGTTEGGDKKVLRDAEDTIENLPTFILKVRALIAKAESEGVKAGPEARFSADQNTILNENFGPQIIQRISGNTGNK
tara:strand:+ start:174 stop:1544 length:1371 start_codon:yes stop_codon:yes gene_type:complete